MHFIICYLSGSLRTQQHGNSSSLSWLSSAALNPTAKSGERGPCTIQGAHGWGGGKLKGGLKSGETESALAVILIKLEADFCYLSIDYKPSKLSLENLYAKPYFRQF